MYGLIGKIIAHEGSRDELAGILAGMGAMPGCLAYIVAHDASDQNVLWVTEAWGSAAAHRASLDLSEVKSAIARGRPLIAGFEDRHETVPIGGIGLQGDDDHDPADDS